MKKIMQIMGLLTIIYIIPFVVKAEDTINNNSKVVQTKYYKTTTFLNLSANKLSDVSQNFFSQTVEITEEEYYNADLNSTKSATVETTYKKMTTSIQQIYPNYQYKVVLEWKNMPSTRSYDIIGIGYPSSVKSILTPYFENEYCTTPTSCYTSTAVSHYYNSNNGNGVVFPLPSGTLYSMKQTLFLTMSKNTSSTIYTQYAYGDYAHAVQNVSLDTASSFYVNTSGIVHTNGSGSSYDSINYAKASWYGTW